MVDVPVSGKPEDNGYIFAKMLSFLRTKILKKDAPPAANRGKKRNSKCRNITWNETVCNDCNDTTTKLAPPENELQKVGVGERKMSEHELRVQRSLQKLNVPEWYKNSNATSGQGFLLKRNSDVGHNQSQSSQTQRWNASTLPCKTTSLSSLGTTNFSTPRSPNGGVITATSPTHYTFSRWSTSRLNSATSSNNTSPSGSARSSFNYRQPYLGWRSQEKLSKPRTPAERLAAGILPYQNQAPSQHFSPSLTEVRSSIKEVTSAIVHYVSGTQRDSSDRLTPSPRYFTDSSSRSASPRGSTGRLCWVESSFVGSRPLDTPETPSIAPTDGSKLPNGKANGANLFLNFDSSSKPPKSNEHKSPLNNDVNETDSRIRIMKEWNKQELDQKQNLESGRRVSFEVEPNSTVNLPVSSKPLIQCQYPKCGQIADFVKAKRSFKVCHNCDFMYCSRECRRYHWEKHRKACLHSRVGELCRKVLSMIKQNENLLHNASITARKGFLTEGRGCVKYFFSNPQIADQFACGKFKYVEPVFIKWNDLSQNETGSVLYAELQRMCKTYNPDTRMVVYVAIYVVSEIPTNGPVEWERQIVARCAKTKLSPSVAIRNQRRSITHDEDHPETLILTSLPGDHDNQKNRQISFTNIQQHLRQRGVNLQKQFPEVYKRLCAYVGHPYETFTPVTIYPTDCTSGKTFMCIIMPDAEPEKVNLIPKDSVNVQTIDVSKNIELESENF